MKYRGVEYYVAQGVDVGTWKFSTSMNDKIRTVRAKSRQEAAKAVERRIEQALTRNLERENRWSEAIVVGSLAFVENVKSELGSKAMHRDIEHIDGAYTLREQSEVYDGNLIGDTEPLRLENAFL